MMAKIIRKNFGENKCKNPFYYVKADYLNECLILRADFRPSRSFYIAWENNEEVLYQLGNSKEKEKILLKFLGYGGFNHELMKTEKRYLVPQGRKALVVVYELSNCKPYLFEIFPLEKSGWVKKIEYSPLGGKWYIWEPVPQRWRKFIRELKTILDKEFINAK